MELLHFNLLGSSSRRIARRRGNRASPLDAVLASAVDQKREAI
jgi:hypothetical protein